MAQQHGPSGSSGAYFGDSGGPIFWVDPSSGSETVVAIVGGPVGGLLNDKLDCRSALSDRYRVRSRVHRAGQVVRGLLTA